MYGIKSNKIIAEELGHETLLVDASTQCAWSLNDSAAWIWKHCDRISARKLAEKLSEVCGVNAAQARADIDRLLEHMAELGWISVRAEPAVPAVSTQINFSGVYQAPAFRQSRSLGLGPRRRPSPRGNSGPG